MNMREEMAETHFVSAGVDAPWVRTDADDRRRWRGGRQDRETA